MTNSTTEQISSTANMIDSAALSYTIRLATESDASELARLLTVLGHPTTAISITAHWEQWVAEGNVALVAARTNGILVGVATLHRMSVLHRRHPVGRITALVVDTLIRGQGVGRALVAAAEEVLLHTGCGLVEITSNVRLVDAHAFYEHIGYEQTSIRLIKTLASAD